MKRLHIPINHFKDDEVEGSFDGVTTTIGETAYTLVCGESSDTFKIGDKKIVDCVSVK